MSAVPTCLPRASLQDRCLNSPLGDFHFRIQSSNNRQNVTHQAQSTGLPDGTVALPNGAPTAEVGARVKTCLTRHTRSRVYRIDTPEVVQSAAPSRRPFPVEVSHNRRFRPPLRRPGNNMCPPVGTGTKPELSLRSRSCFWMHQMPAPDSLHFTYEKRQVPRESSNETAHPERLAR